MAIRIVELASLKKSDHVEGYLGGVGPVVRILQDICVYTLNGMSRYTRVSKLRAPPAGSHLWKETESMVDHQAELKAEWQKLLNVESQHRKEQQADYLEFSVSITCNKETHYVHVKAPSKEAALSKAVGVVADKVKRSFGYVMSVVKNSPGAYTITKK